MNADYKRNTICKHKYSGSFWTRSSMKISFSIHKTAWRNYCNEIHSPISGVKHSAVIRETLLKLMSKYYIMFQLLPTIKQK